MIKPMIAKRTMMPTTTTETDTPMRALAHVCNLGDFLCWAQPHGLVQGVASSEFALPFVSSLAVDWI